MQRDQSATKEVLGKWSAECEALRGNLKAAAARNAEQKQSNEVLKQELADLEVKVAKKGKTIENIEKTNDQLMSELEQLEHYNQYLDNECRKKDSLIDGQRVLLGMKKPKQRPRRNFYWIFGAKTL